MIAVLNGKQAEKSEFKNYHKMIISDVVECFDKRCIDLCCLLPEPKLYYNFVQGKVGKKEYRNSYLQNILDEEEIFANILTILTLYRKGKKIAFVCSDDEFEYGYMQFLTDFITGRYGIDFINYKELKKRDFKLKFNISKKGDKRLKQDLKSLMNVIKGVTDDLDDEKKSKKKKKKHKKDDKKSKKHSKDKNKKSKKKKKSKDKKDIESLLLDTSNEFEIDIDKELDKSYRKYERSQKRKIIQERCIVNKEERFKADLGLTTREDDERILEKQKIVHQREMFYKRDRR